MTNLGYSESLHKQGLDLQKGIHKMSLIKPRRPDKVDPDLSPNHPTTLPVHSANSSHHPIPPYPVTHTHTHSLSPYSATHTHTRTHTQLQSLQCNTHTQSDEAVRDVFYGDEMPL